MSDRICVIQLITKNENNRKKSKGKSSHVITIINVYAPTTDRVKKHPNEIEKLYANLNKLCDQFEKQSTSVTIIAGDFNAKVGKSNQTETCLGAWSRGKRNDSGSKLIQFCEERKKIIANSCFQHPAKHITTWAQQRTIKETNTTKHIYNQIDYIILDQHKKQSLVDARTFSGTETHSDHRLLITRIEVNWAKLYKKALKTEFEKKFDTKKLINDPAGHYCFLSL